MTYRDRSIETSNRGMSILVMVCRIIVGVLFIFSGLVKANDPQGLAYKMQEFYDVWKLQPSLRGMMIWLDQYALMFSVIMITLEIVVGVALLIGWKKRLVVWLLILLMIFFTFLTGYAVLSGKIRTCGCFGDCIPLTAMQSFIKDIVLCILGAVIFVGVRYINPALKRAANFLIIILSVTAVLFIQWYVLQHNPLVDCLPFKKSHNIIELRKMPADAVADKVDFMFIYEKNGEKKQFGMSDLPDSSWKFVERKDIILEKGRNNEPPIKDFNINTIAGTDTTDAILSQPGYYYLFFVMNVNARDAKWLDDFRSVLQYAKQNNRPVYLVASQPSIVNSFFNVDNHFNLPVYSLDVTALKTASRTDPSLYLMHGPVIENKWGWADLKKAVK
ncbi:DoxX family protein [soil metagenome]